MPTASLGGSTRRATRLPQLPPLPQMPGAPASTGGVRPIPVPMASSGKPKKGMPASYRQGGAAYQAATGGAYAGAAPTPGATGAAPGVAGSTPGAGGATGAGTTLDAQVNPALAALGGRYTSYLDQLSDPNRTDQMMSQAGGAIRDLREGGRRSLIAGMGERGVRSGPSLGQYEAETARGGEEAIADVVNTREAMLGGALQGGVGVYGAPAEQAMREKELGLRTLEAERANAWRTADFNVNQAQQAFQNYLNMYQLMRQAPSNIHTGWA